MTRFLYGKPLILAHRCLYPGYPENTIPSLQKVIAEGADYVEIDCVFTKDKRLIVTHDSSLGRTTDGKGEVEDLTFDTVRKLNAAHYIQDKKVGFVFVPTVEEIFQTIQPTKLCAELHIRNLAVLEYDEPHENVLDLMVKYNLQERCNINIDVVAPSEYVYENAKYKKCRFSLNAYIEEKASKDKQHEKLLTILNSLRDAHFFGLDLKPWFITKEVTNLIHDYGFELQCYPTNDEAEMKRLIESECDVLQTDRMDLCKKVCQEMGF